MAHPPLSFFPEVTSPSLRDPTDLPFFPLPTCSLQKKSQEKTVCVRPCTVKMVTWREKWHFFVDSS